MSRVAAFGFLLVDCSLRPEAYSPNWSSPFLLFLPQHCQNGLPGGDGNDFKVKPKAGILYIPGIPFIPFIYTLPANYFSMIPFYLGQPGYAWFYQVAEFVTGNQGGKRITIGMHMWAGTNQAH